MSKVDLNWHRYNYCYLGRIDDIGTTPNFQ